LYQNIYIDNSGEGTPTVYIWDDVEGLLTLSWSDFNYAYVADPKGNHITMTGKRVSKTRRFIRGAENVFESDLPRETRVLTDLYLDDDTPSKGNTTLFFDIEVAMSNGLPDIHNPNNEITSIALYDPHTSTYYAFVLDKEGIYENTETTTFCRSEIDLLHKFMNMYESIAPTIITGWNSDYFDIPYLYNRMVQVCGKEIANRLSPIGIVRYSDRQERYKIAGVSCLDYMVLYKKFTYTQQPNYRLDTIARMELGRGKVEYEGSLDLLFKENLEKFIEYNLEDVKLLVDMDAKLKFIELARGICHVGHVPYEDYSLSSRFLEGTIVVYLHRKGIVVTDRPKVQKVYDADGVEVGNDVGFAGAYVKVPMPSLYNWIYSLDLQSLYPSIIRSFNISKETKVGKVLNFNIDDHVGNQIKAYVVQEEGNNTTDELSKEDFLSLLEENNLCVSSNGVLYRRPTEKVVGKILVRK
jgi:DNA polymerase elongation subunit (family B)